VNLFARQPVLLLKEARIVPDHDIIIVGAGIAGSALAVALSGRGLSIALIEAQALASCSTEPEPGLGGFDARVSALTPNSRKLLEGIAVWPGIAARRLCPYDHMTVWDAEGTAVMEFDCADVSAVELGYIVENRVIVSALLDRVRGCPDVSLYNPARVAACEMLSDGTVRVELEDKADLSASLLVAADGANSPVRQMLEFPTREWDYGHRAIVASVQLERSHRSTAWQRFMPSGPLAFLPLPDIGEQHYCSIVWSVEADLADELLELDDEVFALRLGRALEHRLGEVLACSPRFAFPLRQRHAVDYVAPGVALVGDAAHSIHPLAGQGINLGLQDVAVLAEEILAADERGISPGQLAVLKRYQRRRKGENLAMMAAMDGFKRLFSQRSLPLRWLRNAGMRGIERAAPIKARLMRHAMGIKP
jgi:2-polyprenylphenol 6-hydroxylase